MKLYLIHTGYYDKSVGEGFYEQHTNIFIVAKDPRSAREKVKKNKDYIDKRCISMVLKRLKILVVMISNLRKAKKKKQLIHLIITKYVF